MMALRSVAASLLLFACVNQAQAQDNEPGTQGRIVKIIQATIVDVPVTGPFDARMDRAVASRPIEVGPDDAEEAMEAETAPKAFQQAGIALAGPSALAAASKLALPKPRLFDIGESIFFLPSQRSQEPTTRWEAVDNDGQDPQVAAGHSLVAVLTWDLLTFYDKSGKSAALDQRSRPSRKELRQSHEYRNHLRGGREATGREPQARSQGAARSQLPVRGRRDRRCPRHLR